MKTVYDADYFIRKFEAIPANLWLVGEIGSKQNSGAHCALGHVGCKTEDTLTKEAKALVECLAPYYLARYEKRFGKKAVKELLTCSEELYSGIVYEINDCQGTWLSKLKTPKARILHALNYAKNLQKISFKETKERIVYKLVEVDSKVKELVKQELICN